jgi:hypothetical protein
MRHKQPSKSTQQMRAKLIIVSAIVVGIGATVFVLAPSGCAETPITDVSQKATVGIKTPWFPFRNSVLSVAIQGHLDGEGRLPTRGLTSAATPFRIASNIPVTIPRFRWGC